MNRLEVIAMISLYEDVSFIPYPLLDVINNIVTKMPSAPEPTPRYIVYIVATPKGEEWSGCGELEGQMGLAKLR